MTTFTIKHDTSDSFIRSMNCEELKDALCVSSPGAIRDDVRYLKKAELVARAVEVRNVLRDQEASRVADAEKARLATVEAERANEKVVAGLNAIADAFQGLYDGALETITKFQQNVANANPETNDICSRIHWDAEKVFLAYAVMDQVVNHSRYYRGQAERTADTQHTLAEMKQHLNQAVESRLSDMLRVSMSQSTNQVANVQNMCELKAKGQMTTVLRNLQQYFDEIMTDASVAKYIKYMW